MSTSKKTTDSLTIAEIREAMNELNKYKYYGDTLVIPPITSQRLVDSILYDLLHITLIDGTEMNITAEEYYDYLNTWNAPEFDDIKKMA